MSLNVGLSVILFNVFFECVYFTSQIGHLS